MGFDVLFAAPTPIPGHALAAIAAFVLGVAQLVLTKGTQLHRIAGYGWVLLMLYVAGSSFFISEIKMWGPFSWIHILSIVTIASLPYAVIMARRGNITAHKIAMLSMFGGALVIAGAFTFLPGRVMHQVVFGS